MLFRTASVSLAHEHERAGRSRSGRHAAPARASVARREEHMRSPTRGVSSPREDDRCRHSRAVGARLGVGQVCLAALVGVLALAPPALAQSRVPSERALEALVKASLLTLQRRQRHRQLHRIPRQAGQALPPAIHARAPAGDLQVLRRAADRLRYRSPPTSRSMIRPHRSTATAGCSSKATFPPSPPASCSIWRSFRRTASGSSSAST